jgi:hypothetical protein
MFWDNLITNIRSDISIRNNCPNRHNYLQHLTAVAAVRIIIPTQLLGDIKGLPLVCVINLHIANLDTYA